MKRTELQRRTPLRAAPPLRGRKPLKRAACRKRRFADEVDAKLALAEIQCRDGSKRDKAAEVRAYKCPECRSWHLTSLATPPPEKPKPKAAKGEQPFPERAARLIDIRDSIDADGLLVRICQRCGSPRNLHRHHRRVKAMGGSGRDHTQCVCNAITLCKGCHGLVHGHSTQARAEGFLVLQAVAEPGSVGVMRFAAAEGGATQWPDCAGRWLETAPEALEVA